MTTVKFLKDGKTCLRFSTVKADEVMRVYAMSLQQLFDEIIDSKWTELSKRQKNEVIKDAIKKEEKNEKKTIKRKFD